ncbi:GRAM domain-containing protein 4 [Chionoecetes opilio]|uniref:GRAM domain-containing protein 4 n=1 Tax=Chionoecetes opilio TaxID=41210 RepID=A0A8J5CLM6_CHIOP|nr:GRAM domain-containing protein 4 [Chionoecetes opilio]
MKALIRSNPKMENLKGDADQLSTETQLSALQEQLVAVMLENQHLADEARTLRESSATEQLRQQLEREREKSRILMERLQDKDTKDREKNEREARDRERHTREKSLPSGDKSPSLPQRIRKRINQMHKTQSFEVEESCPGTPQTPVADRLRLQGDDKLTQRSSFELSANQNVKYGGEAASPKSSPPFDVVESSSRGRFAWKRRGLEKSKSLDQSEFLASLNSASSSCGVATGGSGTDLPTCTTTIITTAADASSPSSVWPDDDGRRDSDSDDGDRVDLGSVDLDPGMAATPITPVIVGPKDPWWRRMEVRVVTAIGELLRDFSEVAEEEQPDGDPEGDPLTVKNLKENILRFGCVMRPLTELSAVVTSLLRWESPSATLLALFIYLYSVVFGWLLTLMLLLAMLKLSFNYLKKSLCLWEHEATQRLYLFMSLLLVASLLLPAAQLFTLTGIYLGLKFFVLDFIFFRYPRIRIKYDTTSRLWDTLPTDADLERRAEKNRNDNGNSSPDLSSFLELFNLPPTETPLPGWQSGRRCTLVNRDRSLTSAFKNGRLYLTNRLGKQEKPLTSTKLTMPTNKLAASPPANKLTVTHRPKGSPRVRSSASFSSKNTTEGIKKTNFTKSYSETASTSSGFSFLNISKSKGKDAKDEKEEDLLELQKMLEGVDEQEPIIPSKLLFATCEVKGSPKKVKRRELSHQTWKSLSETKENQPRSLSNTKGALLHSLSEQCELQHESSGDEGASVFCSSPDIKRCKAEGSSEQESDKAKHRKSCLTMLKSVSIDDAKSRTSVIDKINDRVFSNV